MSATCISTVVVAGVFSGASGAHWDHFWLLEGSILHGLWSGDAWSSMGGFWIPTRTRNDGKTSQSVTSDTQHIVFRIVNWHDNHCGFSCAATSVATVRCRASVLSEPDCLSVGCLQ